MQQGAGPLPEVTELCQEASCPDLNPRSPTLNKPPPFTSTNLCRKAGITPPAPSGEQQVFLHVAWGRHQDHPLQHHLWGWDPVTLKNPPGQNSALLLQPIWQPETLWLQGQGPGSAEAPGLHKTHSRLEGTDFINQALKHQRLKLQQPIYRVLPADPAALALARHVPEHPPRPASKQAGATSTCSTQRTFMFIYM